MAAEQKFLSYDWAGDEKWQLYKLNVIIPHDLGTPQHKLALDKIKRKYYRRNIDPSFEEPSTSNPTPKPSTSSSNFSEGPNKFPDFKSPLERPSSSSSSSSSPSSSPSSHSNPRSAPSPPPQSAPRSSSNPSGDWTDILSKFILSLAASGPATYIRTKATPYLPNAWFCGNVLLLLNSLFYCFGMGTSCYYTALSCASIVYLSSLCMSVHFTPDSRFLKQVYSSDNFSFLLLSLVFNFMYQPVFGILLSAFLLSLLHTSDFVMQQRMISHPLAFTAYQKLTTYRAHIIQFSSSLKGAVLFHLLLDLVMGRGSLFVIVFYTIFFFTDLSRRLPRGQLITGLDNAASHPSCPAFIRSGYLQNVRPLLLRSLG